MAALLAIRDYAPALHVPLGAYVRMRVMGQLLARYRREWTYARRQVSVGWLGRAQARPEPEGDGLIGRDLKLALGRLSRSDQQLAWSLYWLGESEQVIAHRMGISQQAVSRRKCKLLGTLRTCIKKVYSS